MKRKILCLLLLIMLPILLLSGCSSEESDINGGYERFKEVNYSNCVVYVDKETRVMYLFTKIGYGAGLTVMLDENGNPLIWEGDL